VFTWDTHAFIEATPIALDRIMVHGAMHYSRSQAMLALEFHNKHGIGRRGCEVWNLVELCPRTLVQVQSHCEWR